MRPTLAVLGTLVLLTANAHAKVQSKVIAYQEGGVSLKGYFAWDDARTGKRPAVLLVHEWWGLNDYARKRADQLAKLGYAAFALDMYGEGKVTSHPSEAGKWASEIRGNTANWLSRAQAGLQVLKKQPLVDTAQVAAVGYCFGGSTVLQLAYAGTDLKAVVSFHGDPVPAPAESKPKAKILICHGASDAFIPEAKLQAFRESADQVAADWQIIYYARARHGFTNPDAGDYGIDNLKYDPHADQRSWDAMQSLFAEVFPQSSSDASR